MVALSIGLWQLTQPADLCCASSIESPSPGEFCLLSACIAWFAGGSDAAVLPAGPNTASPAQTQAASNKTCPNRRRENRRSENSRITSQNVSLILVNPEINTRLLRMSPNPAPGTRFDTPDVITDR